MFAISATLVDKYFHVILDYLPKIIGAIFIYIIGIWLINLIVRRLRKVFRKREIEVSLGRFLLDIINIGLKILLTITIIAKLGIETSSLIAAFGAAGLAVGLALQGSLSNFAGGVLIILLKPFKIGDWIEADGVSGTVKEISIFHTRLIDGKNLQVVIPNGGLANTKVINYSIEGQRMDYIPLTVPHGTDILTARKALTELMAAQEGVFTNPAPTVVIDSYQAGGIVLSARFVSSSKDFWRIHFDVLDQMEIKLKSAGISLSAPGLSVNLQNNA